MLILYNYLYVLFFIIISSIYNVYYCLYIRVRITETIAIEVDTHSTLAHVIIIFKAAAEWTKK